MMSVHRETWKLGVLGAYAILYTVLFLAVMPNLFLTLELNIHNQRSQVDYLSKERLPHPVAQSIVAIAKAKNGRCVLTAMIAIVGFGLAIPEKMKRPAEVFNLSTIGVMLLFGSLNLWVLFSVF